MQRFAFALLVVAAACGGSKTAASTAATTPDDENAPVVGPPQVAWKDMTEKQRGRYMGKVVMPKMKPLFQQFDPKGFEKFECETCHGKGAEDHTFKMPN